MDLDEDTIIFLKENDRIIKEKQDERLWYFAGNVIAGIRSGAIVLIVLILITKAPNAGGIVPESTFFAALNAVVLAGPNLGNVLCSVYSLFFTCILVCLNCSIGVCIGVNQWVVVGMVFLFTFTNFYFVQMAAGPSFKNLTAGITNAFLVIFHNQRDTVGLPQAIAKLWWNMTSWGVPSAVAIGVMLFPYPALATVSLKQVTDKLCSRLIYTVNVLKVGADGASQNSANFRNAFHLLHLNVHELRQHLARAEVLLKDARWELFVSGSCQSTFFQCQARLKLIREFSELLDQYFYGVRLLLMRYVHHEENAKIFFREVAGAYGVLAATCESVLSAKTNEEISHSVSGKMKEFEDVMIFARMNMIRNQVMSRASISYRKLAGHTFGLQMKPYMMMKSICAYQLPDSNYRQIWHEIKPLLNVGVFATWEQLVSWERFVESFKFAAVAGIAQLLTYLFPEIFQYNNSPKDFYAAMTVAFIAVVQSSGSTIQKCIFRVVGTAFGGIYTLFVFLVATQPMLESGLYPTFMFALFSGLSSYLSRLYPQTAYAYFVMGITPFIISLDGTEYFTSRTESVNTLIVRLLDTGVGAGLTIMAAMVYTFPAVIKLHNLMTKILGNAARVFEALSHLEVSGPLLVEWNQDMGRLPPLLAGCEVDPALWRIPYSPELFLGVKRTLSTLSGVLNTMENAVSMIKSRDEEMYFAWIDKRTGMVNREIVQLLNVLSHCFLPPSKRCSDSRRIPVILVDIIDKYKIIRLGIENDLNRVIALMVERSSRHVHDVDGIGDDQVLLANTDILPNPDTDDPLPRTGLHRSAEYFANITYQSVATHALLHEFFNLCDVLRELTSTIEAYLASYGLFYLDFFSKTVELPERISSAKEPTIHKVSRMLTGNPV